VDPLIACVDVDYRPEGAVAAGVWFRGWAAESPESQAVASIANVAEYQPGEFYRRELPCLVDVLARGPRPDVVIVDGYVWLQDGKPGLGAHLHAALGIIVVGVAKTQFVGATDVVEVKRGQSQSPLYVTAAGVSAQEAAARVAEMHGEFRVPTLLKLVDSIARTSAYGG
jgi:deoxyribonuclease V